MDDIKVIVMLSTTIRSRLKMDFDRDMEDLDLKNQEGELYLKYFGVADEMAGQLVHYAGALKTTLGMIEEQREKVVNPELPF